jgi:hypothetical protein
MAERAAGDAVASLEAGGEGYEPGGVIVRLTPGRGTIDSRTPFDPQEL